MKETTASDQEKEKKIPDVNDTDISVDKKMDLKSPEMKEEEQMLEKVRKLPVETCAEVDFFDGKNDGSDAK